VESTDVNGLDLAGGDELVEQRASDVEALGGVLDRQEQPRVGLHRDVQRATGLARGTGAVRASAPRDQAQCRGGGGVVSMVASWVVGSAQRRAGSLTKP